MSLFSFILTKVGLEKAASLVEKGVDGVKIFTATKSQKETISFIKFAGLFLGYLGVANAGFIEKLGVDDLILISQIILKYPFLKWTLLAISTGYLANALFKIDCFAALPKVIYGCLKFIFYDFLFGAVETIFDKDKTYKDFFYEVFQSIAVDFALKKIERNIRKKQEQINALYNEGLKHKTSTSQRKINKQIKDLQQQINGDRERGKLLKNQ